MKILSYECHGRGDDDWRFSRVDFQQLNLLVGDTATGKTRLLNTIFNLGAFVATDNFRAGYWDLTFNQDGSDYRWIIQTDDSGEDEDGRIVLEQLLEINSKEERAIVTRDEASFLFLGRELPKLSPKQTSIALLKEEPEIEPIYRGFGSIRRRRFFHDALSKLSELQAVNPGVLQKFERDPTIRRLYNSKQGLNVTLYIMSRHFPDLFGEVRDQFRTAFPFVAEADLRDLTQVAPNLTFPVEIPVFCIRERSQSRWVPITEMSSGMQKVLLILTDIFSIPDDSIYIIDEYENSLGISAIDFFPTFVLTLEKNIQFFVTSHHPYIINEIPPRNWYLFHRKGTTVSIKYGDELEERFGKSKQRAFIQLINDPFYIEGVE